MLALSTFEYFTRTYHLHNDTKAALDEDTIIVWTESVAKELTPGLVYLKLILFH